MEHVVSFLEREVPAFVVELGMAGPATADGAQGIHRAEYGRQPWAWFRGLEGEFIAVDRDGDWGSIAVLILHGVLRY